VVAFGTRPSAAPLEAAQPTSAKRTSSHRARRRIFLGVNQYAVITAGEHMKRRVTLTSSVVLLLLTACPAGSPVGGACDSTSECQAGLTCGTNYPSGYCSRDCTTADSSVCGSGSACVSLAGRSTYECYETCSSNLDCRVGYRCRSASNLPNGYSGICLPN
jgi:hypothetical protein